jgi:hypothetical protein
LVSCASAPPTPIAAIATRIIRQRCIPAPPVYRALAVFCALTYHAAPLRE